MAEIILDKINYTYSDGTAYEIQALKDVNLQIHQGEFIGIIGHTGSGKSTLTQLLNGLLRASSGSIYVDGQDIYDEGYDMKALRSKVGLVFQYPDHQLFETTCFEDVCFGPKNQGLDRRDIELRAFEALRNVGFPEELFYQPPFDLSGGQKRRVAIAGVLAMKPDVLILDEPTAGLDPAGRDEILGLVSKMHRELGITILLVSHSMEDVAEYVDRIIVMNHGAVMFDALPKQVFAHYKELEAVGLAAPQVTYLVHELAERGLPVDTQATTAKEGIKTYTCTVCKATKTEKIAKLKPTNSSTVKKGTKVTIKGYKYTVKNSSEVTFTGVKNKKASKISIPATVKIKNKKYKVTAMSEKSLKGVQAKTIIVGNNVQTIGNSAMENCKQLTKVTLGKNVKKIGKNVFKSDKKLKNITIKSTKLKSVGKNAFKGINSKAKITVPKKKYTSYKKLMKGKGQGKKVKIVKAK